jgi:hypothetical protein
LDGVLGAETPSLQGFLPPLQTHVPLAMQKVEGSNPFSRSQKGLHSRLSHKPKASSLERF